MRDSDSEYQSESQSHHSDGGPDEDLYHSDAGVNRQDHDQNHPRTATAWAFRVHARFPSLNNSAPAHDEMQKIARQTCLSEMPPEMQHFTIVYAAYPTHDSSNSFLIKMTIYIQSKLSLFKAKRHIN